MLCVQLFNQRAIRHGPITDDSASTSWIKSMYSFAMTLRRTIIAPSQARQLRTIRMRLSRGISGQIKAGVPTANVVVRAVSVQRRVDRFQMGESISRKV